MFIYTRSERANLISVDHNHNINTKHSLKTKQLLRTDDTIISVTIRHVCLSSASGLTDKFVSILRFHERAESSLIKFRLLSNKPDTIEKICLYEHPSFFNISTELVLESERKPEKPVFLTTSSNSWEFM